MGIEQKNSKLLKAFAGAILLGSVVMAGFWAGSVLDASNFPRAIPHTMSSALHITSLNIAPSKGIQLQPVSLAGSEVINMDEEVKPFIPSAAYNILYKTIREELRQGRPTYALKLLSADPMAQRIKNSEYDRLRGAIAQSYLVEGLTEKAMEVAKASSKRSKHEAPSAAWVGGIAAWKMGNYSEAADFFATAADSSRSTSWLKSASAFWASRAFNKIGNPAEAEDYLEIAARHPRTFYGLIALRSLDREFSFNWDRPELTAKAEKSLKASASVQEALRLSKKGEMSAAMTKLGSSGWLDRGVKQRQVLAYILEQDTPALAMHLGRITKTPEGQFYDTALYPEAPWDPEQGYMVDRALVNALIRQESRFNPKAANASGATGLMQLMPSTASYMAKGIDVSLMTHPQTNISVGQKYIRHLLMDRSVNNDLFHMAIAYNAGPGNLSKWKKKFADIDDPLLFIESIPSSETRAFVERVMVNYWIYRIRMGKDNPSLDAVAAGERVEYIDARRDDQSIQIAFETN